MAEGRLAAGWADATALAGVRIRSNLQYRTSFLVGLVVAIWVMFVDFLGIVALFGVVPALGGWSIEQVAFLYATAQLSFGFADLTVGSVERIGPKVRDGSFDSLLLRPVNVLVHLTASEFELRRLNRIIHALGVGVYVFVAADIPWTAGRVAATVLAVVNGAVMASAVWVVTASVTFWTVTGEEMGNAFTYGSATALSYPLHVFDDWLRQFLTVVVPVAFVNYLPAVYVLDAPVPDGLPTHTWLLAPLVSVALVALARVVWRAGVAHYHSTGS